MSGRGQASCRLRYMFVISSAIPSPGYDERDAAQSGSMIGAMGYAASGANKVLLGIGSLLWPLGTCA